MKIDQIRPGVFDARLTAHELSTLVAAARMALAIMERDGGTPTEARAALGSVLEDFDRALARNEPGAHS